MTRRLVAFASGSAALMIAAGCGGGGDSSRPGADLPQGSEPIELDPAAFTTEINNRYWPMVPGTRWVYREIDEEGGELDVVVTVSTET